MKNSIYAVIAAKDEAKAIGRVIKQTKRYVDKVIVVDDGSHDKTSDVSRKAGAIVLRHIVNLGKGAAVTTGIQEAISEGAKYIVLLDADGQHEPKDIPKFISKLKDHDIVFGIRTRKKSMPIILKFGNWVINKVTALLFGISIDDTQCGYRAFKAETYKKIRWESTNYSMESEMIANLGRTKLRYTTLPISTIYADRYKGTTIIDGIKIILNMIWWRISNIR